MRTFKIVLIISDKIIKVKHSGIANSVEEHSILEKNTLMCFVAAMDSSMSNN